MHALSRLYGRLIEALAMAGCLLLLAMMAIIVADVMLRNLALPGWPQGLAWPVRTKVGHSFIKQVMAETGAVFGGEHSAHYYFRDNYRADSGLIATMLMLEEMSRAGEPLSVMRVPYERYSSSGEINTQVDDPQAVIDSVSRAYSSHPQDRLDGLTVDCGSWWFNVRPSNTEPLLRLNLEAPTREECDEHVAALLALVTA